ncbi:MAG: GNAT family N-acetyltransferase [Acidobacteria bacterium]|nr:GNAT family N-acetyltransferase [Acidobacteriota bacterium]
MQCRSGRARLKYLLGEFVLFDLQRPAWICRAPFPPPEGFDPRPEDLFSTRPPDGDLLIAASWPVAESEKRIAITQRNLRYVPAVMPRYYVALEGSFQQYLASNFQAKTRKNVLRSVRKMREGGAVFRVYLSAEEMESFLDHALKISELTYQTRMLGVGLPASEEFRETVLNLARQGLARGYLLYVGEQPAAFAYCTCEDSNIYYSTIGYDPQHAGLSPGTVLLYHILEHVFRERRFQWFDFGIGEAQYKSVFGSGFRTCGDVYFFRLSAKNASIVLAHAALDRLSATLGRALERAGVKSRIRKWLRSLRGGR